VEIGEGSLLRTGPKLRERGWDVLPLLIQRCVEKGRRKLTHSFSQKKTKEGGGKKKLGPKALVEAKKGRTSFLKSDRLRKSKRAYIATGAEEKERNNIASFNTQREVQREPDRTQSIRLTTSRGYSRKKKRRRDAHSQKKRERFGQGEKRGSGKRKKQSNDPLKK